MPPRETTCNNANTEKQKQILEVEIPTDPSFDIEIDTSSKETPIEQIVSVLKQHINDPSKPLKNKDKIKEAMKEVHGLPVSQKRKCKFNFSQLCQFMQVFGKCFEFRDKSDEKNVVLKCEMKKEGTDTTCHARYWMKVIKNSSVTLVRANIKPHCHSVETTIEKFFDDKQYKVEDETIELIDKVVDMSDGDVVVEVNDSREASKEKENTPVAVIESQPKDDPITLLFQKSVPVKEIKLRSDFFEPINEVTNKSLLLLHTRLLPKEIETLMVIFKKVFFQQNEATYKFELSQLCQLLAAGYKSLDVEQDDENHTTRLICSKRGCDFDFTLRFDSSRDLYYCFKSTAGVNHNHSFDELAHDNVAEETSNDASKETDDVEEISIVKQEVKVESILDTTRDNANNTRKRTSNDAPESQSKRGKQVFLSVQAPAHTSTTRTGTSPAVNPTETRHRGRVQVLNVSAQATTTPSNGHFVGHAERLISENASKLDLDWLVQSDKLDDASLYQFLGMPDSSNIANADSSANQDEEHVSAQDAGANGEVEVGDHIPEADGGDFFDDAGPDGEVDQSIPDGDSDVEMVDDSVANGDSGVTEHHIANGASTVGNGSVNHGEKPTANGVNGSRSKVPCFDELVDLTDVQIARVQEVAQLVTHQLDTFPESSIDDINSFRNVIGRLFKRLL
ncbi:unnamed protein product [Ambrosiozyma monospora]|uniref:Unnamed protein product n=2 Tax=Ambrosiozyma monospora TaxID=43982 RepID=A0ACB5T5K0_AMBMO|nr:unnamed protein product [Ambrosiozyma monospora]